MYFFIILSILFYSILSLKMICLFYSGTRTIARNKHVYRHTFAHYMYICIMSHRKAFGYYEILYLDIWSFSSVHVRSLRSYINVHVLYLGPPLHLPCLSSVFSLRSVLTESSRLPRVKLMMFMQHNSRYGLL